MAATFDENGSGESFGTTNAWVANGTSGEAWLSVTAMMAVGVVLALAVHAAGGLPVDVLVITKDQEFLTTIKESSRGVHEVHYANTLKQADELIRKHKIGVAVVDAATAVATRERRQRQRKRERCRYRHQ